MIFIGIKNIALAKNLKTRLMALGTKVKVCRPGEKGFLNSLYDKENSAIVTEMKFSRFSTDVSIDILNSLCQRMPVVVLTSENTPTSANRYLGHEITVVDSQGEDEILASLGVFVNLDSISVRKFSQSIPYFNVQMAVDRLKTDSGLGIIYIDTSAFNKIGLKYGVDVYAKLKDIFQDILFSQWGEVGSFRESDILCRKSRTSNVYYLFLTKSRNTGSLPHPGALNKLSDRLTANVQNAIWEELTTRKRNLPACVTSLPAPSIGYIGVLDNPCIDPCDIVENGIERAKRVAMAQSKRQKEMQLELMQTLIQSDSLLQPNYQAVFHLADVTKEDALAANEQNSIAPLADSIYGFESLIRVNIEGTKEIVESGHLEITGLEPKFLRPDILFNMAENTKVSLELDQACLKQAAKHAPGLPGVLMVNILPRNLYYIDKLKFIFKNLKGLIFEVSESEAINNFDLMKKSCSLLESLGMHIAADDFGKGFSSLERIIQIKPAIIKFDRSMIENIHADPIKQAYVRGMVEAARIINTTVLAEGVETWEETEVLQSLGIDLVQGYLFHRPSTKEQILKQLTKAAETKEAS